MTGKNLSTDFVCSVLKEQELIDDGLVQEISMHESAYRTIFEKQGNGTGQFTGVDMIAAMGLQSSKNADMVLSEEIIMRALASHWRLPFLRIDAAKLDPVMIRSHIPETVAVKHQAIPVSLSDNTLVIAIVNPLDVDALEAIKKASPLKIHLAISTKADIQRAIERCYSGPAGAPPIEEGEADETTRKFEDFFASPAGEYTDQQRIVDAVNLLVHYAIEQHSTEIQMKPKQDHCMIQFRIDGVLYDVKRIPLEVYENMLGRLRSLAGVKTSDGQVPQEGRTQFKFHDYVFRLELSTIPIVYGEKLVLRILDPLQLFRHVYDLGLSSEELDRYMRLTAQSSGLIIVAGPVGSGKTTTLYSTLKQLAERGISIVTIEHPMESMCEEFTQIAIHQSIGVTFEMAMQHILHLSPVALMVGVKRNREVFEQTLRIALAGHLVLAEFQAHDAIAVLVELLDMNIPPYLIESAVTTVVAQRLLRKVCEHCTQPYQLSENERAELQMSEKEAHALSLQKGAGCVVCRGTGYAGQTAIFEILEMTNDLRTLIHQQAEPHLMREAAVKGGMRPFRASAIDKMKAGITTPEEVLRVTGGLQAPIPHTFKSKITLSEN